MDTPIGQFLLIGNFRRRLARELLVNIINIWHSRDPVAIKLINIIDFLNIYNIYNIYKFRASKFINITNIWHSRDPVAIRFIIFRNFGPPNLYIF